MTEKERNGVLVLVGLFIVLAIVLVFTMDKPEQSNTWGDNPLVNEMPNRTNP